MALPVQSPQNVFQTSVTTNFAPTAQSVLLVARLQTAQAEFARTICAWPRSLMVHLVLSMRSVFLTGALTKSAPTGQSVLLVLRI